MLLFFTICYIAGGIVSFASAASNDQWRGRSVYQVLTDRFARTDGSTSARCNSEDRVYCGGTWRGIINHLDYIQGMGFSAIYISPITKNFEGSTTYGEAYHGFWQQDIYSINGHFGSADDLRALSKALHDRNMYLMVDTVVNHNAWPGPVNTIDYSKFVPFNQQSQYHDYCLLSDFSDDDQSRVENCWLGDPNVLLADLKTQDSYVQTTYQSWIRGLVADYSVDGLRVDTTKHVNKDFFPPFVSAAGVFMTGEVLDGDIAYTCDYQNYLPSIFNYPTFYPLIRAFTGAGSIQDLVNSVNAVKNQCRDTTLLGSFSENHDQVRFASRTQDLSLAKNVIAFTILADGIPFIYAGQEQHYAGGQDPYNREATWFSGYNTSSPLYRHVAKLNQVRNQALYKSADYLTYKNNPIWWDASTVAMRKGFDGNQVITVLSNRGAGAGTYTVYVSNHGHQAGTALVEVLSCSTVTVDGNGFIPVTIRAGEPWVLYPLAQIVGSGICGR